jgi:hypothetical protein
MPDDAQTPPANSGSTSSVFIPLTLRQQYPDIVDLILQSESMNDEERQYWIDILPVMTPDQVTQLRTILTQEREQLAAIDAKYGSDIADAAKPQRSVEEIGQTRKQLKEERSTKEKEAESVETATEEEILKKVQDL